jgi:hypothetical protein
MISVVLAPSFLGECAARSPWITWPWLQRWGLLLWPEQSAIGLVSAARRECPMPETARHPDMEMSTKKYCETTIGELRKTYGADFAKGCADNERIADCSASLSMMVTPKKQNFTPNAC